MGSSQNTIRPHCSVCILTCPQIAVCRLAERHERNISRRQSVFQPSTPTLESTLPPVISQANSVQALRSKLAIYLFFFFFHFLAGELYSCFPYLGSDSLHVETYCWELVRGCCLVTMCLLSVPVCMWLNVFVLSAQCVCVCVCVCVCACVRMWCSAYFF